MTKEELREDPLLAALARLKVWIEGQGTVLTIVLAALVIAVVGYQIYRKAAARSEQAAAILLIDGESQYMNGSPADALSKFKEAYAQHKSAPSGRVGLLRAADMQLEMGDASDAETLYKQYLGTRPKDGLLRASALRGLAGSLDSAGQHEEAARTYVQASEIPESPLRADDLVSAGNAFLDAGKLQDAQSAFQKVIEGFPESQRVRDAREGLAAIQARSDS
jgi:predicted negative regulator of RcsB-dependent stress response